MTGRGLLTEREREVLAEGEAGSYLYKTRSVVRDRIDALAEDAAVLAGAEPELYAELVDAVDAAGRGDMEPGGDRDQPSEPLPEEAEDRPAETDPDPLTTVLDDLPGGVDREAAHETIGAARELIAEGDGATKGEIVRELIRERPLGYNPDAALAKIEAGDRYRGAWWRRVVKPGLEAVDDVEKPAPGRSEWRRA